MQSKPKFQNSPWAKFNQSDWRIWVTWPELTNQRRVFCAFPVFCAQRARRKIFVPWLGNFGHVTWAKKKGDCFNFKIISPFSFPRILFSFSYSSSLFSLMLHLPFLSFHCIHLPLLSWFHFHCTCYVPCDDHQSAYFLYLSINTYLLFSWLRPVHWPLSLLVYLHIDTYLSFLSQQVMSCSFSHANQGRLTDYHLCQPGSFFDRLCFVVSGIWASEHSHHRSAHLLCRWAFIVLPWSVLCRSWASGLLLCSSAHYQQTFFFLHIFFDLNQRPLPLKPSTLLTVLARLRWWCEE